MTQQEALTILKTGANVFLTGEPGSGKTHTVNAYVRWLREHDIKPAITASTGIAATHINGFTIHSWCGIGVRRELSPRDLDAIVQNKNVSHRVRDARVLIVDEISMLSARTLALVEVVCRKLRNDQRPFGALQEVFVGDFFQLPPVSRRDEETKQAATLALHGDTNEQFAFASPVWQRTNFLSCYLSEQHRQEDTEFLAFLSILRRGTAGAAERALLRTRYAQTAHDVPHLYTHNADVDALNLADLARLSGKEHIFEMANRGPKNLVASLKRGCLSPEILSLKVGARVMFTKNDVPRHRYVNGTLGIIAGFVQNGGWPIVNTKSGSQLIAEPDEWHIEEGGRVLARIIQVPLRLAWAITVHKSQGMSLDAAHMNLANAFEYGQGYVAFSRVRTLNGLSLSGLNARALEVHPEILSNDAEFRASSDATQAAFAKQPPTEILKRHANFIHACGGNVERQRVPTTDDDSRYLKSGKAARWQRTLELIASGMNLEEVAEKRGRKIATILEHLEAVAAMGKLNPTALAHLANGKERDIERVQAVLKNLQTSYVKPVFDQLNGAISYETIRLARLLGGSPLPTQRWSKANGENLMEGGSARYGI